MTEGISTRELVLQMLIEINENGQYSHLVLRQVLEKYQYLERRERAFMTRLTEGTIERQPELDYMIDSFSKTKIRKMKPLIRNLLRMSVYQLKYMDSIPDSAACNEAVKLAKRHGFAQLGGFVNGVLRNIARNMDHIAWPDEAKDPVRAMEIRYCMPQWIIRKWLQDYGREKTEQILTALGREYPLSIRCNTLKNTPQELKERLIAEGVTVQEVRALPYAFGITGFDYLNGLDSFLNGLFYVQDISSMMVAETADPKPGDYVIDVCAAPGGKSTHAAEKLQGSGMVEARDLTPYKVSLIEDNIARHELTNMKAVCMDATVFDEASVEKADVLICDLPCSGLGVMGRKTDIRYKSSAEKAEELVKLQRQILDTVCSYVKKGGVLLYSTCTINTEENEKTVAHFLASHPGYRLVLQRQIFPGEMGQDGFFLAKIIREQ